MRFFFRRSASFGPLRLNFSRDGVGASFGVKGARVTMTPRGTTYVTVGSHGFYYRETLSGRGGTQPTSPTHSAPQHLTDAFERTIPTASALDLVDSSVERLIQLLNERANMSNPAWLLYGAAAICIFALVLLPQVPRLPSLPAALDSIVKDRNPTSIDEYSALVGRFGEHSSVIYSEADKQMPIPVATANYAAASVGVAFVPGGCTESHH